MREDKLQNVEMERIFLEERNKGGKYFGNAIKRLAIRETIKDFDYNFDLIKEYVLSFNESEKTKKRNLQKIKKEYDLMLNEKNNEKNY